MKRGVNFIEQNTIKRLHELGHSAEDIARDLRLDAEIVSRFIPDKPKARKAKQAELLESEYET
jgi:hypothetical protein